MFERNYCPNQGKDIYLQTFGSLKTKGKIKNC